MKRAFLGSSNCNGNSRIYAEECCHVCDAQIVNISDYELSPWDYSGANVNDRFQDLIGFMLKSSDIIFCTPVYWYSMSCQMKTFFDRFSDLITRKKEMGRALAGKRTWLVVVGNEASMPEGFEVPFKRTSEYFDMKYMGAIFGRSRGDTFSDEDLEKARVFGRRIEIGDK